MGVLSRRCAHDRTRRDPGGRPSPTGLLATSTRPACSTWPTCTPPTGSRVCGDGDESVALALALTVRALRLGSVCLDLTSVADDCSTRPRRVSRSASCRGPAHGLGGLLPGAGSRRRTRGLGRSTAAPDQRPALSRAVLAAGGDRPTSAGRPPRAPPAPVVAIRRARALDRLFPVRAWPATRWTSSVGRPRCDARQRITVIAGGPGTGKTTTVAALLTMLADQPGRTPRIALAAPTGKAAARLTEAVTQAAAGSSRSTPTARRPQRGRRCTGCSGGCRAIAAGSGTTPTTGCRTTSWSSTRCRWSR